MLPRLSYLFTPRSKPPHASPPDADASQTLPVPQHGALPLATPRPRPEGAHADSSAEEEEDLDTPQPKLVDSLNYQSPTVAVQERRESVESRPGPAQAHLEPGPSEATEEPAPTASRGTMRGRKRKPGVPGNGAQRHAAARVPRRAPKRQRVDSHSGPDRPDRRGDLPSDTDGLRQTRPSEEATRISLKGTGAAKVHVAKDAGDDDGLPLYEASTTVAKHCFSVHVRPTAPHVAAWTDLRRRRCVEHADYAYYEKDAIHIQCNGEGGDGDAAVGLVLEMRDENALVAWYYTSSDAKAQKRPAAWAARGKTHILSSHVDVIPIESFSGPPLTKARRKHFVEDRVLNLTDPNGRVCRLRDDTKACVFAEALW